jgi:hypothetical protein
LTGESLVQVGVIGEAFGTLSGTGRHFSRAAFQVTTGIAGRAESATALGDGALPRPLAKILEFEGPLGADGQSIHETSEGFCAPRLESSEHLLAGDGPVEVTGVVDPTKLGGADGGFGPELIGLNAAIHGTAIHACEVGALQRPVLIDRREAIPRRQLTNALGDTSIGAQHIAADGCITKPLTSVIDLTGQTLHELFVSTLAEERLCAPLKTTLLALALRFTVDEIDFDGAIRGQLTDLGTGEGLDLG